MVTSQSIGIAGASASFGAIAIVVAKHGWALLQKIIDNKNDPAQSVTVNISNNKDETVPDTTTEFERKLASCTSPCEAHQLLEISHRELASKTKSIEIMLQSFRAETQRTTQHMEQRLSRFEAKFDRLELRLEQLFSHVIATTVPLSVPNPNIPLASSDGNPPVIIPKTDEIKRPRSILVLDDKSSLRTMLRDQLETNGFVAHEASTGQQAKEILDSVVLSGAVLDVMIDGECEGKILAKYIRDKYPNVRVIVYSGDYEQLKDGPTEVLYLKKPFQMADVIDYLNILAP